MIALPAPPGIVRLFRLWLSIGAQSFGGGAATSYLIQQTFVERLKVIEPEEYAQLSAMVQLVPGMNLLALTVLLGWRFHRARGVVVSLLGLLAPSVSIALLMSASYLSIQSLPITQAALKGVVPAMAGVSLTTLWRTTQPVLAARQKEGIFGLGLSIAVIVGGVALSLAREDFPVFGIYLASGAILATWFWVRGRES